MGITPTRVAVIGGGISGLSAAYRLKRNGNEVVLFEAGKWVGGKIGTMYSEGFELDLGPVTISETPTLNALVSELGLEIIPASNATSTRYIYSKGKLHRVGPNIVTSSLLSLGGKLSMLKAPFTKGAQPLETVSTYARRRFGEEAYQRMFNPMMNGIYAGNAELLSATAVFKKQGPRKIVSIKGGMRQLTDALSQRLGNSLKKSTPVNEISKTPEGIRVCHSTASDVFDKVHFATPAFVTASLIRKTNSKLAAELDSIRYCNVSQIYCEVIPGERKFDGFGFLIPSEERLSLLGAICVSNIFPEKAPDGKMLFVLFCGGDRPYDFSPSVENAVSEFNKIIRPAIMKVLHVEEWKNAIPQFYVGHEKIVDQVSQFERANPEMCFTGNYINGVAVGNCV
jgi:oxygen-dependent protoporphyrinogen oxidase